MHGQDAGVAQLVEHQPSKLNVAGSNPVARFHRKSSPLSGLKILSTSGFGMRIAPLDRSAIVVVTAQIAETTNMRMSDITKQEYSIYHANIDEFVEWRGVPDHTA